MHLIVNCFGNPLTTLEYSSIIIDNFIVPLNLLQNKTIFQTFSGSHCHEHSFLDYIKYILLHALLICFQIKQLANVY
jgi:hypothetical protein